MKVHFWFKTVLCGVLAGFLVGFVLTAFLRRPLTPRVGQRSEDMESVSAKVRMTSSRAGLFQQLLKPYLIRLRNEGSLPPSDIFKLKGIIACWSCADTASCAEFLNSAGMAVLLKSDPASMLASVPLDASSVLEEARRLPTPELRDSFLRTAIARLAEQNPAEALRATHSLPRWLMKPMQKRVAEIWVKRDLRGALQSYFDDQQIDRRDRKEVVTYALHAAAKQDLEQAFDVINSLRSSSLQHLFPKDSAISELFAPLDEKDSKLIRACIQKLPESSLARQMWTTRTVLAEMERGDAALPEAVNLKNTYHIEEIAWRAAYVKEKSLAEIQGILDQIPGVNARTKAYKLLASYRAAEAPEETVKWAATIADPPTRAAAFAASFERWVSTAPEKAIAYVLDDWNRDATARRQLDLEILDWAYSDAPDIDKSLLAKGFRQLSPEQQAQFKNQITSTFDALTADKVLKLFQQ